MSGHSSLSIQDMNPPAVLWDVDFDFFLDSERTVLEDRNKDYWLRPEVWLDAHRSAPRTPVVHHQECLRLWDQADLRGWVCVHFDAHPDLFDEADPGLGNLTLGRRGDAGARRAARLKPSPPPAAPACSTHSAKGHGRSMSRTSALESSSP